ncbi:hypothetical protein Ancab_000730 [Ancistrocladus abbreviatus]
MDFIQQGQGEKTLKETFSRQFPSPTSLDMNDSFGDLMCQPRVGSDYQVEIPPLLTESELLQYLSNSSPSGLVDDVCYSFLMGLPIPITWVSDEVNVVKDEGMGFQDELSGSWKTECIRKCQGSSNEKDLDTIVDTLDQISLGNDRCPVPGLSADCWTDFEVDCFILGLYIFGKNLLQVQRFVERKHMGQILSFYYGKFYRSVGYCRWSDWSKTRRRKSMLGHRFFTGSRQQELLTRLLPRLSGGSKNTLQEVSKAFAGGRTLLEDYVHSLRNVAGIHALIDAIGIGKSHDLTNVETSKSIHNTVPPDIPAGKASSLACSDIIKFLTGDFRLSKAQSNDLFWEAVWPRLLARGWHSEQPKGNGYTSSKRCLVFLMPGVKKFSRRKLTKGEHYFDSVTDVFKKVASKPGLLMLDAEENLVSGSNEANGWVPEANSDDNTPDHGRHTYLQSHFSRTNKGSEEFTIVDTTLMDGAKPSMVRELRRLPVETKTSVPMIQNKVIKTALPRSSIKTLETTDIPLSSLRNSVSSCRSKGVPNGGGGGGRKQKMSSDSFDPVRKPVNLSREPKPSTIKHQLGHPTKLAKPDSLVPFKKRRRLAASSKAGMAHLQVASIRVEREPNCVLSLPAVDKRGASKACRSQKKISSMGSLAACQEEKRHMGASMKIRVKPEGELLTGLILHQIPAKPETTGQWKANAENNHSNLNAPVPAKPEMAVHLKAKAEDSQSKQNATDPGIPPDKIAVPQSSEAVRAPKTNGVLETKATIDARRHSMRNRPMSTKALEALESSFLHQKPTKKRLLDWSPDETSRHSQRPYNKSNVASDGSGVHVTNAEEKAFNGFCDGRSVALDKPLIQTEQEAASELLGLSRCSTPLGKLPF